jgi:putative cardiolipin synthase
MNIPRYRQFIKSLLALITLLTLTSCSTSSVSRFLASGGDGPKNSVAVIDQYRDAMQVRHDFMKAETKGIYAQHFIVREDTIGLGYFTQIREARRRGIPVKLIFDDWASVKATSPRRLTFSMVQHLIDEGVEIKFFHKIDKRAITTPYRYMKRMHEKLVMFKGSESFLVGDRDAGGSYYGMKKVKERFVSRDILVKGDVSQDAFKHFEDLWDSDLVEEYDMSKLKIAPTAQDVELAKIKLDEAQRKLKAINFVDNNGTIDRWTKKLKPVKKITFLGDGVGKIDYTAHKITLETIKNAKKSVLMSSPYVILNKKNASVLKESINNGAKITLLTNSARMTDEIWVPPAYDYDSKKLTNMGVDLWEGSTTRIFHAKSYIIDEKIVIFGSNNFDNRSQRWDRESGIMIEDEDFAAELKKFMMDDKKQATKVDPNRLPLRKESCRDYLKFIFGQIIKPIL